MTDKTKSLLKIIRMILADNRIKPDVKVSLIYAILDKAFE